MNKGIASTILFFILFSLSISANENIGSPEEVLSEIQASHGLASISQIGCGKVTEQQFEEIGDAMMEQMHPGKAHEAMDAMMGGEGSESLKAMHVSMGKNYLQCNGGTGMMGSGSMMGMTMMHNMGFGMPFFGHGYWSIGNILYALLFAGLVALFFLGVFKLGK